MWCVWKGQSARNLRYGMTGGTGGFFSAGGKEGGRGVRPGHLIQWRGQAGPMLIYGRSQSEGGSHSNREGHSKA